MSETSKLQHGPRTTVPGIDFHSRGAMQMALTLAPGLIMTAAIAGEAILLHAIPRLTIFSPMILAILLGAIFQNLFGTPAWAKPGVTFALKRVLRLGIILLGLQLVVSQIVQVGLIGCVIITTTLISTFLFTKWLGRMMGVESKLAELIGAGTSICGASAVIATNTVTQGSDEDVAYAVACVTVFGTAAMFLYPLLPTFLNMNSQSFGLWSGSSIHEIAQVVAAAYQNGPEAARFATVAKLTRIMLLAPLVMTLGLVAARRATHKLGRGRQKAPPMPWFVLGFIALMLVNSVVRVPAPTMSILIPLTSFLLSMALAAMGLETDFRKLKSDGLKPMALGAAAWMFIALFSLALIKLSIFV